MSRRIRTALACLCLAAAFLWFDPCTVRAEDEPVACIMTGEDVGNGYEYTAPGIGSFTVNGTEGETLQAAVFEIREGCFPVLYRNGEETDFENGMVLDSGEYELRLYRTEEREGVYGVFRFSVKNDFAEALTGGGYEVTVEDNPPLTLEYDEKKRIFRYRLPDGRYFETNVPVGGWSRSQADFTMSDGLNVYQVYRDGEPIDFSQGLTFSHAGSYEIIARDNELGMDGKTSYRLTIGFRLYSDRTMDISHINAPQGLFIARVLLDGKDLDSGEEYLHMDQDGEYRISFQDQEGHICWETEFERDTVPPCLIFDRPADGLVLKEPVSYTLSDRNARLRILRNGQETEASRNRIGVNGVYRIEISDDAGNTRDYEFSLGMGHSIWNRNLIIIPFFLLAGAGAAFAYWKRNMRVL